MGGGLKPPSPTGSATTACGIDSYAEPDCLLPHGSSFMILNTSTYTVLTLTRRVWGLIIWAPSARPYILTWTAISQKCMDKVVSNFTPRSGMV